MDNSLLPTFAAHIASNTSVIQGGQFDTFQVKDVPNNGDGHVAVAQWYNLTASPAFIVWRTSVGVDEVMQNGFDWTRVDNLSVGKARIWDWMFRLGTIDPSKTNIRAGIDAVWTGTAADLAVRTAVYTHCKRLATNAEKLFAAGVGSGASPATMVFVGLVSPGDVGAALNP